MWPSAYKHGVGTPDRLISLLNSPAHTYPCPTLRCALAGRQRMARGHRESLLLRRTALSSASPCRFLPALSFYPGAFPSPASNSAPGRPPPRPAPTDPADSHTSRGGTP